LRGHRAPSAMPGSASPHRGAVAASRAESPPVPILDSRRCLRDATAAGGSQRSTRAPPRERPPLPSCSSGPRVGRYHLGIAGEPRWFPHATPSDGACAMPFVERRLDFGTHTARRSRALCLPLDSLYVSASAVLRLRRRVPVAGAALRRRRVVGVGATARCTLRCRLRKLLSTLPTSLEPPFSTSLSSCRFSRRFSLIRSFTLWFSDSTSSVPWSLRRRVPVLRVPVPLPGGRPLLRRGGAGCSSAMNFYS